MAKKTKGRAIASNRILADPHRNSPMACAMCMISQSRAIFNLFGEWRCYGDPNPVCPDCQSPMICWDTRQRHLRQAGGTKRWGRIFGSKSLLRSCGAWIGISTRLDFSVFGLYPFRLSLYSASASSRSPICWSSSASSICLAATLERRLPSYPQWYA